MSVLCHGWCAHIRLQLLLLKWAILKQYSVMITTVQRRMYKTLLLLSPRKNVQVEPDFRCLICGHSMVDHVITTCHRGYI